MNFIRFSINSFIRFRLIGIDEKNTSYVPKTSFVIRIQNILKEVILCCNMYQHSAGKTKPKKNKSQSTQHIPITRMSQIGEILYCDAIEEKFII